MAKSKKVNRHRQPRSNKESVNAACKLAWTIMFSVLADKEGYTAETLQRVWREVDYLSDSIAKGYVNCADLRRTLRTEYGVNITD